MAQRDLLRAIIPGDIPRLAEARIDLPATLFAITLGSTVALLIGLIPAMRGTRADLQSLLRAGAGGTAGDHRLRQVFVAAQVALAVVLGCGAALLVRSAQALESAPRGYDASGVFTASVTLPSATYRDASTITASMNRIIGDVAALPGVTSASVSSQLPFAGGSPGADLALADQTFADGVDRQVRIRLVAPDYLHTLGIVVRAGRDITNHDVADSLPVVVVNQTLARGPRQTIEPEVLLPLSHTPGEDFFWISRELQLAVRTSGNAAALSADVRRAVFHVDPAIPIGAARTLEDRIDAAFSRERKIAQLLTVLGVAGLAIALLGLAGAVDYQVRRQRRDTAIRLALGASASGVITPLVAGGTMLAVAGAIAGTAASLGIGPLLGSLLFSVRANDPWTLGAVALTVVSVSITTAWVTARSAARVDPAELLRS